jgi:hypothetical protein
LESGIACVEIDQVAAVAKNGTQRIAQRMLANCPDLGRAERLRKPLHVVLHEDLHRCAADRASAVNGRYDSTCSRNGRAHVHATARGRGGFAVYIITNFVLGDYKVLNQNAVIDLYISPG